jgi:hypothetical protein
MGNVAFLRQLEGHPGAFSYAEIELGAWSEECWAAHFSNKPISVDVLT